MVSSDLFKKSQKGDLQAQQSIFEANTGLIYLMIRRLKKNEEDTDDLFQVGTIGLLKAIRAFNPDYGVCFSTYAVPVIMGEMKRYLRDNTSVSVSRSYKELAAKAKRMHDDIVARTGKNPTISELASALSVTTEELGVALSAAKPPASLEEEHGEGELSLADLLPAPASSVDIADRLSLEQAIQKLSKRDKTILYLRYFREQTQTEIAKKLGISQVQVSRLEKKLLEVLKEDMRANHG
ncbi:MAG: sigma-70 family RNA polymerase sigma factor [Ruminococcaceae bacterium]|nr:sigma-70 family RNA polymerase sigma factor [Oscillospiraceae bacterium]